jgi:DNA helicase HerA-like ATPase
MSSQELPTNGIALTELQDRLAADIATAGGAMPPDPELAGAVGCTMFDLPGSEDLSLTVLLSNANLQRVPAQALVRIKSRVDRRSYLGVVTAGPFAEPDSLKADSQILVAVATRGANYLPPFHGRVELSLLGEELSDGSLAPPRLRPLPNSPVFVLSDQESEKLLHCDGDLRLGLAVGHEYVKVGIPSQQKSVLPRHTAVVGTTGGGKSTTIAGLVREAQKAGMAVILLDVEGEYTHLHEPTDDTKMLTNLKERQLEKGGVPADKMTLYHLVGRDTANPHHPHRREFSLQFARLSPYAVMEILDLSDAQQQRFLVAYDIASELLRRLDVFPQKGNAEQERLALELDEFERGYPRLTPALLLDVIQACHDYAEKPPKEDRKRKKGKEEECAEEPSRPFRPRCKHLQTQQGSDELRKLIHATNIPSHPLSWRALIGRLSRLHRLKVFFTEEKDGVWPLSYKHLLEPGAVSVLDLSDTGMSELNNLVIADLLRGVQDAQDDAYTAFEQAKAKNPNAAPPTRVLVIIEEAHEFLSAERIERMNILFEQVAKIAKRGRKRWLGLVFVTQLPQHLPRQIFGLVNSYILHKITDPQVVATLRKTVSGIDEGLWERLPGLAPGQAIVSFPHMTRPLLASIDPAGAKLRLVD